MSLAADKSHGQEKGRLWEDNDWIRISYLFMSLTQLYLARGYHKYGTISRLPVSNLSQSSQYEKLKFVNYNEILSTLYNLLKIENY